VVLLSLSKTFKTFLEDLEKSFLDNFYILEDNANIIAF